MVKVLITGCLSLLEDIYISNEVRCLYGCIVYHIFFIFFWFYFVSLYRWLYVLLAAVNFVNNDSYCYAMLRSVYCFFMLFYVLFVCNCVLYCRHSVSTQLQLTNTGCGRNNSHIIHILPYKMWELFLPHPVYRITCIIYPEMDLKDFIFAVVPWHMSSNLVLVTGYSPRDILRRLRAL
jgi:hypothetical protein